jgi:hypothetical protein
MLLYQPKGRWDKAEYKRRIARVKNTLMLFNNSFKIKFYVVLNEMTMRAE